jgi:hypothetical protein
VCQGATIYTEELRIYACSRNYGFIQGTFCHKHKLVNRLSNVNTQAVESFILLLSIGLRIGRVYARNIEILF